MISSEGGLGMGVGSRIWQMKSVRDLDTGMLFCLTAMSRSANLCLLILIVRFNNGSRPSSGPFLALLLLVNSRFNGFVVRIICAGISFDLLSKSFVKRGLFFLNVELVIVKDTK